MNLPFALPTMNQIHAFHPECRALCFKSMTLHLGDWLRSNPLSPLKTLFEASDSLLKVADSVAMNVL